MAAVTERKDNTFGRGYVPPFSALSSMGRYSDAFKPRNWLDHSVFVDDGVHMVTVMADSKLSITAADLESMLYFNLEKIQVNEPGTVSFYFREAS